MGKSELLASGKAGIARNTIEGGLNGCWQNKRDRRKRCRTDILNIEFGIASRG